MPANDIPQELVDLIIDELHSDIDALRQSSLIARGFLASSRRYIFVNVKVASRLQCKGLHSMLSLHPMIILTIRVLHVNDGKGWARGYARFEGILQLLAESGTLKMFHYAGPEALMGEGCPVGFPDSSAMKNIFTSPGLTSIIVDAIPLCSFPITLLMVPPSLQHFAFNGGCSYDQHVCPISRPKYDRVPTLPPSLHLSSLTIGGKHSEYLIMSLSRESLKQLRTLRIQLSDSIPVINLPSLSNLRFVVFEPHAQQLRIVTLLVGHLPRNIQYLAIVISLHVLSNASNLSNLEGLDRTFARTLTSTDAYPHLQGAYIVVVVPPSASPVSLEEMRHRFPIIHRMGLLQFMSGEAAEMETALKTLDSSDVRDNRSF